MKKISLLGVLLALFTLLGGGCAGRPQIRVPHHLHYVGSSTVALFLAEADSMLPEFSFEISTDPESDGGERAMLAGQADLAGLAREPGPEVKAHGIASAMIGRDALAVIVSADLPVDGLSRDQLRQIYSGKTTNWKALGGPDLEITAFLVGTNSATRAVFQEHLMGAVEYAGVEIIEPDSAIIDAVAATPGGVGFISFAFLERCEHGVRALRVDGREPSHFDFAYPIARPLYLLWKPGTPGAERFVQWALSPAGQDIVLHHYPGIGVQGSVDAQSPAPRLGTLVVFTDTFEVVDGDIQYFPHRSYQVLDEQGNLLRRITNHRGLNDERPTHTHLAEGTYLIRTQTANGAVHEFYATVRPGLTTVLSAGGKL
ncbi:MAG: ABC-type phosphate transport system substrate-binding protein [Candidatus Paceibacteria bacterium]|jgi:ABC-type phosphate transport system substrate-binding protein